MIDLNDWSLILKNVFALIAACGLSMSTHAACYSVYNPAGQLIYQSSEAPVDTRDEYHRTVPQRFGRGATLVYVNDGQHCLDMGALVGLSGASSGRTPARPGRADRG